MSDSRSIKYVPKSFSSTTSHHPPLFTACAWISASVGGVVRPLIAAVSDAISFANGKLGAKREFAKLEGFRQTENGPTSGADGLAVDAEGRLYVASNAGIQVFTPKGEALGVIPLPKRPQNLAFAGPGKKTLYVVGSGSAWRFPVLTAGYAGRAK